MSDEIVGQRILAYLVGSLPPRPPIIDLKAYCARWMPGYMVPDVFAYRNTLPRTSNGKVDYRTLRESSATSQAIHNHDD